MRLNVNRTYHLKTLQALAFAGAFALGFSAISGSALAASVGPAAVPEAGLHSPLLLTVQAKSETEASRAFIEGMAQDAIDFLADQSMPHAQKSQKFKQLLASSFDLKTIGRFALGRYWKVATPAQQKEYQALFENMVVKVYSNRFKEYKGQDLVVSSAKPEGEVDVLVTSFIVPKSGPRVQVDWRVRNKNGQRKIVDIIVEGVSMAVTQRSEFASVIQAGGGNVDVLINHLKK